MKKTLVILLALCFVLSIGATALAAPANPFVDVPAKHWAYDAVSKLAKAGIVDGYGDGTFRGDKTMTRYEMAQIVAKAMARSDKADAENKALIDKLAVEFAAELNNLGVRVAALEAKAPSEKWTGDSRLRYQRNQAINPPGNVYQPNGSYSAFQERFRLNYDGQLSDSVFVRSRLTFQSKSAQSVQASAGPNSGGVQDGLPLENVQAQFLLDIGAFTFKNVVDGVDLTLGRQDFVTGYGLLGGTTGGYDNARVGFTAGSQVKGWFAYGDIMPYIQYGGINTNPWKNSAPGVTGGTSAALNVQTGLQAIDVTTTNWVWTPDKNFQMVADAYWSNTKAYNYRTWSVGAKGFLTSSLYLAGEYAKNTDALTVFGTTASGKQDKQAYFMQLGYNHGANNMNNGIDYANKGAFGAFVTYKKYGNAAMDWNMPSILV